MKNVLPLGALAAALACHGAVAADAPQPPRAEAHMQKVLDALKSLNGKPIETLTPEEARRQPRPANAVKKVLADEKKAPRQNPASRSRT